MSASEISIVPVNDASGRAQFVDLAYRLNASDANWVPNLRSEEIGKFTSGKNPFFEHARVQLFLARRNGRAVGRIAAHIDELALAQPTSQGMGPGTGFWGAIEAEDENAARTLITAAEDWLRQQGMQRVLAPMNLSVWEEPGLLVKGHDHPPMVMMAHHNPGYQGWIEAADYALVKRLFTYDLDVTRKFPPLIQRIVSSGEKNDRIRIREVDMAHFDREVGIICHILNDAWSGNWGFVPFTETEIAYTAKNLKPLVHPMLIRIAEIEGEPAAFMLTLPDLNEALRRFNRHNGKPSPLGWLRLLWWLRKPMHCGMRVPLMGVIAKYRSSRLASQLAFMMIEYIRRDATRTFASRRGEIGWILEDNQGMVAIAEAIESKVNRQYNIYERTL